MKEEKEYYYLVNGDEIKEGDEFEKAIGEWKPVDGAGVIYNKHIFVSIRRIKAETKSIEEKTNPKYYTSHPSKVECIDITEHYDFCIGNAIKYLWRQGLKSEEGLSSAEKQIEDCEKAIWYIKRHIKGLNK